MAKRRSYRAYAPGSVQKKVTSELRHAVSELRHGKAGCKFARGNIHNAIGALENGNPGYWEAVNAIENKIERVKRQFFKKCPGMKIRDYWPGL